ncbi:MAG TPA: helix-turn-helix domain-containing protein [Solirubrobacterales bacterium]|jgi:DNA-binding HxlR family transcriptional regulator|nr:helix-turn-helix domain-containing protein [Solirubrobacterales bacterium]
MGSRQYGQSCSLACALDQIGERWTLLIVRELSLGPLRFSALARSVGGAPTDVLTKRLRDLEQHSIVARRELGPPASATVYELTELGRGLERPMLELSRWGMGLQKLEDVIDLAPSSLPNAIRVILRPPTDFRLTLGLSSGGQSYELRIAEGWIDAARAGGAGSSDVSLAGEPIAVIAALVAGEEGEAEVGIDGDRELLDELRSMIEIPEHLREEALAAVSSGLVVTARTA